MSINIKLESNVYSFAFIDAAVNEQRRIAATLGPCSKGGNHELRLH